jgi:hypothetical protein
MHMWRWALIFIIMCLIFLGLYHFWSWLPEFVRVAVLFLLMPGLRFAWTVLPPDYSAMTPSDLDFTHRLVVSSVMIAASAALWTGVLALLSLSIRVVRGRQHAPRI